MVAEADIQLVEQIRRGDSAGLDALYDKYADEIWRFTLMRVKDPDVAWDIVQETFARAADNLPTFEGGERAAHWLHRVAKNLSSDHHRRKGRFSSDGIAEVEDAVEGRPEAMLVRAFEHQLVRQAFTRLSPEDQAILWAREVEGRSVADLAVEYGMTNGAMRVKLTRARVRLRFHAAAVGLGGLIPIRIGWPWTGDLAAAAGALLPSIILAVGAMAGGTGTPTRAQTPALAQAPALESPARGRPSTAVESGEAATEARDARPLGELPVAPGALQDEPERTALPRVEVGSEPPSAEPIMTLNLEPFGVPLRLDVWAPECCPRPALVQVRPSGKPR